MAKLPTAFTTLLSNIEPESKYKKYAQDAHEPVRNYLEQDDIFGEFMDSSFLYGSYRRSTAVGNIKDIDIALITRFDPNSEDHTPKKVLSMLKSALNKYYKEEFNENNNTEYQRKSILVKTPLPEDPEIEMTLDILPAIAPNGSEEVLLVPDRELSTWVESHPKAQCSNFI